MKHYILNKLVVGEKTLTLCDALITAMVITDMLGGSMCCGKSSITKHLNSVDNLYNGLHVSASANPLSALGLSALALAEGPDPEVVTSRQCLRRLQGRSLSECSVDSEDSFIVFHGSPGAISCSWNDEDNDSSSDEDEMCSAQGSDGELNGCDSDDDTIEDTCDGLSQEVEEINQHWQLENPPTAQKRKSNVLRKQVCFAPPETLQTVHPIIAWDFAYRASRIGPWEEMARDRARFRTRIERTEEILAPVLSPIHRKRMLERRDKLAPSVD